MSSLARANTSLTYETPDTSVYLEDSYVVSPLQAGMLFHSLYVPHQPMYVRQIMLVLREAVNVPALKKAWTLQCKRHPILRSSLRWEGLAEPVQEVYANIELPFEQHDWRAPQSSNHEDRLRELLWQEKRTGFRFSTAPLMRLKLIRLDDADFRLVWTYHHIVSDGYSDVLTIREVFGFYDSICRGEQPQPEDPLPYRAHCEWLRARDYSRAEAYWRELLKGFSEPTPLGMRNVVTTEEASSRELGDQSLKLPAALTTKLKTLAHENDLTLSTMLHGAWALLLSGYSGKSDVVFGGVRGCRSSALDGNGARSIVGPFINTLPIRVHLSPDSLLLPWLKTIREQWIKLRDFEHTPLLKVLEWSELPRGSTLFESAVAFDKAQMNTVLHQQTTPEWQNRELHTYQARSNYPLTLAAYGEDEFLITVRYDQSQFDDASITLMLDRLRQLFEAIVENPEQKLASLTLLTPEEKRTMLYEWNQTASECPRDATMAELFAEQVARRGEAVAVVSGAERVSYAELNERANRLAHYLRGLGVGPEALVGVCVERSVALVVSLLGVLKAGGAYLPLDAANPRARLEAVIAEAGARVLLINAQQRELFAASGARLVCVDSEWEQIAQQSGAELKVASSAEQLAYCMFTSGSTGVPNGVCVTQRAVVRLVKATNYAEFGEGEVFLQLAPLSFDASTLELWGSLLNGGRLVLMAPGVPALDELGAVLRDEGVTTLWLTAGLFHLLVEQRVEDLLGLRQLLAGGDVLAVGAVQKFLERSGGRTQLINGYGPTENTTFTCCHSLQLGEVKETAPIGRPIANTRVYLLNDDLEPVPVGVNGELYIAGDGLARGYLQRAELTAEKFIPNPYGAAGERMYRSGDTARYRRDGVLEFVGRRDQQVKVRGFRIELGEIEAVLESHPQVRAAAVIARRSESGEQRVLGYVVAEAVTVPQLREYLRGKLPEYMVPAELMMLAELPLTVNGKVDRRALPEPERVTGEYEQPETELEELVAGVWQQVLGVERVSRHDNFFDLGGHSLLATQIMSRLRETSGVQIPLRTIFDTPTIAALAECIAAALNEPLESTTPIERVSREGSIPLSFEQQRLWFFDQLLPGNPFYNVPVAYRITGQLNVKALEASLNHIITRHEVLRTAFPIVDGLPTQQVQPFTPLKLEVVHLASDDLIRSEGQRPFDLANGPVIRAKLFQSSSRQHVLVVTIHHIATDGWSMELFSSELATLYEAYSQGVEPALPELPVQYADYSVWQRRVVADEGITRQLEYWKQQLADAPASLNLPTDRNRPETFSFRGAFERLEIDEDLFKQLETLGRQQGATMFMTLLAAFATMLGRYSGQHDILIGVPIANRTHSEFEKLIGFFTNMIVLRVDLSGNPLFSELLHRVREVFLAAYAHKEIPFERLVEEIHAQRDLSSNPLFQVSFSLQNRSNRTFHLTEMSMEPSNVDIETSKFDLCLYLFPFAHGADGFFGYNRDLFSAGTMESMVQHFNNLLHSIAHADARLSELEMLLDNEKALVSSTSVVEDFEESFSL